MSTNKRKTCENCRRKRIEKIRNGLETLGSVVLFLGVLFINKESKGSKKKR